MLRHGNKKKIFTGIYFVFCTPSFIFQSVPKLVILQVVKLNSVIATCTAQLQVLGVMKVIYWMVYRVLNVMQMNSGQMIYQLVDKLVSYFLLWGGERIARGGVFHSFMEEMFGVIFKTAIPFTDNCQND